MKYFDERFEVFQTKDPVLPLCHSCESLFLRAMLEERKLSPFVCKEFKHLLLYFFYGKPAYKLSEKKSSRLASLMPISIILKSSLLRTVAPARIYPFDTGAFNAELYSDHIPKQMSLDNFLISPKVDSISKTVSYFFGSNRNYYKGLPRRKLVYDSSDFEVECYYNLISSKQRELVDDRRACVEIQTDQEIRLDQESIDTVIIPDVLRSSSIIKDILIKELKVQPLIYETFGTLQPAHYYSQILQMTRRHINSRIKRNVQY